MTDKIGLSLKHAGYCENCEYQDPVIITRTGSNPKGLEVSYYEVVCTHENACRRLTEIFEGLDNMKKFWQNR